MYSSLDPAIDVRLLRTTFLLLRERSVSRVAQQLGHSQPAVSAMLKRARNAFGDPLLVRSGQSLVPTERGAEVMHIVENVLRGLQEAVLTSDGFDPAQNAATIRIGALNCFGGFLVPAIAARLCHEAPRSAIEFVAPHDFGQLSEDLASGRIDLVIGNWPSPQPTLRSSTLLNCGISCIMRGSHPLARQGGAIPMADYLSARHISPTPAENARYSPIDGRLSLLGLRRQVVVTVTEYGQIPALLHETNLMFTSATAYVEHLATSPGNADLVVLPAPCELGEMSLYLLWHERTHNSAQNRWLRTLVRRVAKRFDLSLHHGLQGPSQGARSPGIVHFLSA